MRHRHYLLGMLAPALLNCSPVAQDFATIVERAMHSVRKVPQSPPPQGHALTLGSRASVEIGSRDDDGELLDVIGATRLPSGNIAIADRGLYEVRVYSRQGRLIGKSGRRGEGPGDFVNVTRLWRGAGDTLMVFDMAQKRVSLFSSTGQYIWSWPRIAATSRVTIDGAFSDGTLLAELDIVPAAPVRTGIERRSKHLARVTPNGGVRDTLPSTYFRGETLVFVGPRGPMGSARPPLARFGHTEVHRDIIYYADGSEVVRQLDTLGRTVREFRLRRSTITLTPDEQDRIVAEFTSSPRMPGTFSQLVRQELTNYLQRGDHARFDSMLVDAVGSVWLREAYSYAKPEREWTVVSSAGAAEGHLRLPRGTTILEVGTDYLLVSSTNELGNLVVRELPLARQRSPAAK